MIDLNVRMTFSKMSDLFLFDQFILYLLFPSIILSFTYSERKWEFLLPKEVVKQFNNIENNESLSVLGIERAIDKILRNQPLDILRQLDIPCAYSRLPYTTQYQIREVLFNKELSHDTKAQVITDILDKIPTEQRYIPGSHICRDDKGSKSKYFDSYNAVTYKISFTFKLSELRANLPYKDFEAVDDALRNSSLTTDEKLFSVSQRIAHQHPEIIDKLFFTGIPIHDHLIKKRFQRLLFETPLGGSGRGPFGDEASTEKLSTLPYTDYSMKKNNSSATTSTTPTTTKSVKLSTSSVSIEKIHENTTTTLNPENIILKDDSKSKKLSKSSTSKPKYKKFSRTLRKMLDIRQPTVHFWA